MKMEENFFNVAIYANGERERGKNFYLDFVKCGIYHIFPWLARKFNHADVVADE